MTPLYTIGDGDEDAISSACLQTFAYISGRGEAQTTWLEAKTSTNEAQTNEFSFDPIDGGEVLPFKLN